MDINSLLATDHPSSSLVLLHTCGANFTQHELRGEDPSLMELWRMQGSLDLGRQQLVDAQPVGQEQRVWVVPSGDGVIRKVPAFLGQYFSEKTLKKRSSIWLFLRLLDLKCNAIIHKLANFPTTPATPYPRMVGNLIYLFILHCTS